MAEPGCYLSTAFLYISRKKGGEDRFFAIFAFECQGFVDRCGEMQMAFMVIFFQKYRQYYIFTSNMRELY